MSKTARFVVIINDNVFWMEEKAIQFYTHLFGKELGEKYVSENLSVESLFKIQNDFSIEILMAYEGEEPQSYIKMDSSRLSNQNIGAEKAINLSEVIYVDTEDIQALFKRAEEIAFQRKHDVIWVKVFEKDSVLIQELKLLNYEIFIWEEAVENTFAKQIYFRKKIR